MNKAAKKTLMELADVHVKLSHEHAQMAAAIQGYATTEFDSFNDDICAGDAIIEQLEEKARELNDKISQVA